MATLPSPTSWLVLCHIAQTTTATALLSHYPPSLSHVAAQGILLPTSSLPTFFFFEGFHFLLCSLFHTHHSPTYPWSKKIAPRGNHFRIQGNHRRSYRKGKLIPSWSQCLNCPNYAEDTNRKIKLYHLYNVMLAQQITYGYIESEAVKLNLIYKEHFLSFFSA